MFFSAAGILLIFLFGADLALGAALGASLGLDVAAPDLIASPVSFGAFGAGAESSSYSIMEGCPTTLAMVFLTLSFLLFPSAAGSLGWDSKDA